MSELKITQSLEDLIKIQYIEHHKIEGVKTWKSEEFLNFRSEQLKKLNENFTEFLGKDSEFYDNQFQNSVYQNNMNKSFRKTNGLASSLKDQVANRFKVLRAEAHSEFNSQMPGRNLSKSGNMGMSLLRSVYTFSHGVERLGIKMVKYGMSNNKEDIKKNPAKFLAKKVVALYGAVIAGAGALYKNATPYYSLNLVKHAYNKAKTKRKAQKMEQKYDMSSALKVTINGKEMFMGVLDKQVCDESTIEQKLQGVRSRLELKNKPAAMSNPYAQLEKELFAAALGTVYENLARMELLQATPECKKEVLKDMDLIMAEAKKRYPNAGPELESGKFFSDPQLADHERKLMPYLQQASKDNTLLKADVHNYEAWRNNKDSIISGPMGSIIEQPFNNTARYANNDRGTSHKINDPTCFRNPLAVAKNIMTQKQFQLEMAKVRQLQVR